MPQMRVLFVMRHPAAVRAYSSMLHLLSSRGHEVHLAFRRIKTAESHRELQRLVDEWPGITFGGLPARGGRGVSTRTLGWSLLSEQIRHDVDYLRYLAPIYADSTALRKRATVKARRSVRALARAAKPADPGAVDRLRRTLDYLERCIPPHPRVEEFVKARKPDVVLVSHLAEFGSGQTDYVRAAKHLGIHTGYPVFSWDNLTNKGLIHELPELVMVWNELQADEAVELQGVPREQVTVTGAPNYDHWFDWQPGRSRNEFCDLVGLPADRPFVLYVCSSAFIARNEVGFVRRWIGALRAHGGLLGETGVIVRPHPRNAAQWTDVTLDDERAVVWPRYGEEPVAAESRRNYFDSIYHSTAVVGINTSAQIESAIVARPVHTVLAEEFRDTQQGTLHFQHLKADEFGHLYVGRTMEEHLEQLDESIRGRDDRARNERFLRRFVRPFRLDVPATPRLVGAVEDLAARPAPEPAPEPTFAPFVRLALAPKALLMGRRDLRVRREKPAEPLDELRRIARRLGSEQTSAPIVAGPWRSDEVGELLYWIPFLRWAQVASFHFRERLVVVARRASIPWYSGIGARVLVDEEVASIEDALGSADLRFLPAALVEERRAELAARHPGEQFLHRMLEFEQLTAPDPPTEIDLPLEFVAVRFDSGQSMHTARTTIARIAEQAAVVVMDAPRALHRGLEPLAERGGVFLVETAGRDIETSIIARSSGFVGTYGASAYVAMLLGLPAVAFHSSLEYLPREDERLAKAFLGRPPFGRLLIATAEGTAAGEVRLPDAALAAFSSVGR